VDHDDQCHGASGDEIQEVKNVSHESWRPHQSFQIDTSSRPQIPELPGGASPLFVRFGRMGLPYNSISQTFPGLGKFDPIVSGFEALTLLGPLPAFESPRAILVSGILIHEIFLALE